MFVYFSLKKKNGALLSPRPSGYLLAPYLWFLDFSPPECFHSLITSSVELRRQMKGKADEGGFLTPNRFHTSHVHEILDSPELTTSRKQVSNICCVLGTVDSIFIYLWHISTVTSTTTSCIQLPSLKPACVWSPDFTTHNLAVCRLPRGGRKEEAVIGEYSPMMSCTIPVVTRLPEWLPLSFWKLWFSIY